MNSEIETRFIQAFVRRERRERARFELGSPAKRGAFLSRLCHTYHDVLDMRYLAPLADPVAAHSAILRALVERRAPRTCYVISSAAAVDGQELPLADALERVVGFGLPSIVICIPGTLGYFEAEQEYGPPPRYWLERPQI